MFSPPWYLAGKESHIHEITSSDVYKDGAGGGAAATVSVPEFELVAYLDTYFKVFFRSTDGSLTPLWNVLYNQSERSFVSDTVSLLWHDDLTDITVREVLSFPDVSLDPSYVSEVSSYAQEVGEDEELLQMSKVKVEVTICYAISIVYDEGVAIRLAEMRSEEEERNRKRVKASVETVLEEREWEENISGGGGVCTVCLEEFGAGEKVARLPCSHWFHRECVKKWLVEESNTCPLCRYVVE